MNRAPTKRVVKAARAWHASLQKRDQKGYAANAVWDEIERKENATLRALEKLAGLKRLSLGVKDSG